MNGTEFVECETSLTHCYLPEARVRRENDDNEVDEWVCTDAAAGKNIVLPPLEVHYHEVEEHKFDCASITVSHALEHDDSLSKFALQIGLKAV